MKWKVFFIDNKEMCEKQRASILIRNLLYFHTTTKKETIEKWSTSAGQKNKKSVFIESKIKATKEEKKAVIK